MQKIINRLKDEPVIIRNTLATIAIWATLVGVDNDIAWNDIETGIIGIIGLVTTLWTRSKVTPANH